MATHRALSVPLMALIISSITVTGNPSRNRDVLVAIEEMQRAYYFTFVMLINMVPGNIIQGNVTFLMPNDRILATALIPENAVFDFLLRHSIPSPMLFEHLETIPTGSIIPTSKPEFMLKISNNGRSRFFLKNVRIISPNICTAGSSIRCHGINGVVEAIMIPEHNSSLPSPTCSNSTRPPVAAAAPRSPSSQFLAPPVSDLNLTLSTAPAPAETKPRPQKSGSQGLCFEGLFKLLTTSLVFVVVSEVSLVV